MNKICKNEFLNTADNKMWCGVGTRCIGRSECKSFVDGSHVEQEERFMLKCEKCGWAGRPDLEETGPHTKATCGKCDAYIKMLSKADVELLIKETMAAKHPTMDKAEALDTYVAIRKILDNLDISNEIYKAPILNLVRTLAESHSHALSRIEALETKIDDPLFGDKATQARIDQMSHNFNFLYNHIQAMHMKLCPHKTGTWQDETIQVWEAVREITRGK